MRKVLQRSLLRSSFVLGLALMAGRLAGFARELVLASAFGLSAQADVAIVLLTLPDLLVNLLLSGGLSVALVPALAGPGRARHVLVFAQASLAVTALFGLLALAFVWQPGLWLGLLAPGATLDALPADAWMWAGVAAALPLTALSGVSSAALNARGRFFVAGCGTLVFNLCVIASLVLGMARGSGVVATMSILGFGIAMGALLRWLSQMMALRADMVLSFTALRQRWLLDRALLRSFGAGLASVSLLVLVPVLIRACASWLGAGQLAAFNYAIKLVELPLGILITPLATVAYPRLSQLFSRDEAAGFNDLLGASLQRSLVLALVVVLWGWHFGDAFVALLLGHGQVGPKEQAHVLSLMQLALLSVPFAGMASLITSALNARRHAGAVLRCTGWALLALPLLCVPGLMMQSAQTLMWALPGMHLLLTLLLMRALGGRWLDAVFQSAPKMVAPALVITLLWAAAIGLDGWLSVALAERPTLHLQLGRVLLATGVFVLALFAGMRTLRPKPRDLENLEQ